VVYDGCRPPGAVGKMRLTVGLPSGTSPAIVSSRVPEMAAADEAVEDAVGELATDVGLWVADAQPVGAGGWAVASPGWGCRVVWVGRGCGGILEGTPPASSANEPDVEGLGLQSSRQRCEHDGVVLGSASSLDPAEIDDLLIRPSEVPDEARSFSLRLAAVSR
jgi:hypothetical protein